MNDEDVAKLQATDFIGDNEYYRIDEKCIPEGNILKF